MSTGWNYSDLSKLAKHCGGPEKLLEIVKNNSVQQGIKIGKAKMIPGIVLAAASGITAGGVAVYCALSKKNVDKKKDTLVSEKEAATAEAVLIEKLKKTEEKSGQENYESSIDLKQEDIKNG